MMNNRLTFMLCLAFLFTPMQAQTKNTWRAATPSELESFLPARANVERERIETELRTATGITDDRGRLIAAVVLITAGYSADGKYSHYLLTQAVIRLGDHIRLAPGAYVLGWTRVKDGLLVRVFDAKSGLEQGAITAHPLPQPQRIESFRIWPPGERKIIQIGRFMMPYLLE